MLVGMLVVLCKVVLLLHTMLEGLPMFVDALGLVLRYAVCLSLDLPAELSMQI